MADEPLIDKHELARRLGLSPEAVMRRFRQGILPGYHLGARTVRFDWGEVRKALSPEAPRKPPQPKLQALAPLVQDGEMGELPEYDWG